MHGLPTPRFFWRTSGLANSVATPTAEPVAEAGNAALEAALSRARTRRPFTDGFDGAHDALVRHTFPSAASDNLILAGQIGRGGFLVGALVLMGLMFVLGHLRDTSARTPSGDAFGLWVLALGAPAALIVACRSRSAGVPAKMAFLAIGLTAWLVPQLLIFILLALLVFPARERD